MFPTRQCWCVVFLVLLSSFSLSAEGPPGRLQIRRQAGQTEVFLPTDPVPPVAGTRYRLSVESSGNLNLWQPEAELESNNDPNAPWHLPVNEATAGFFRLRSDVQDVGGPEDGGELFGYNRVFAQNLRSVGFLPLDEFISRFAPTSEYLEAIRFDPTTARFWPEFATDPAVFNAGLPSGSLDRRLYDFRLNSEETARFMTNGFVVSERLGSFSFADVYYRIFTDDLPVFITADSVLHAWHWTYQAMLSELEETQLIQLYRRLLEGMAASVASVANEVGVGPLRNSVLDADYFLTVAQSLLLGGTVPSSLGQDSRVAETLTAIQSAQYREAFPLWGTNRAFDFSQFTVRGHYYRTEALGRYFQAFMWTALADLRVAGNSASPREVGTALVLHELYSRNSVAPIWEAIDQLLLTFVGKVDSLTFRELGPLRTAAGLTLAMANRPGNLEKFQADLLAGNFGVQTYASAAYATPFGPAQTQLPRVFSVSGKRFIPDGWATAQVTFDRIHWNEELPDGRSFFGKVVRRLPSALDVAFGVFGNTQVTPEIVAGIQESGLPYQHNLAAMKATLDQQSSTAWNDSIYTRWLFALRMLSAPTTDPRHPEALRTRAWAHKTVNTQLASWTQLRHDTVLYAAQPYSGIILCEYPAGYVEPRVEFWEAMRSLAEYTAEKVGQFAAGGTISVRLWDSSGGFTNISLLARMQARVAHSRNFAAVMTTLRDLAVKELAGQPFTDTDVFFIRSTMNAQDHEYYGKSFDGWYPTLFYKDYGQELPGNFDPNASDRPDRLVTDVHSAPPDATGFPGGVLHEAVGDVDLLLIAVDSETDRMIYAGPTLSHYEFIEVGLNRLNDYEWAPRLNGAPKPSRPTWTRDYLVPK